MNIKCMRTCSLLLAAGGLVLASGCVMQPDGRVTLGLPVVEVQPAVVVATPPPPPAVVVAPEPVMVPETYVWDGTEFVGFVGDQPLYLGPGDVWLVCEPFRLERFHGWERFHGDWRGHAIRNDRFRRDAHGQVHAPGRGAPGKGESKKDERR
jgi:hypothetical protein